MSDTEFAKSQLRQHLESLIVEPISDGFWSIYKSSKELCEKNGQPDQILRTFQNMLTRIPEWSDVTLTTEVDRIIKVTKCTYMDDLLMGVFIAYMKSFASLHYRGASSSIKIDFERPNIAKFVHELYKHSARKLWQVAYLFKTFGVTSEQQARNRQEIVALISSSMETVIRSFLPWEAIAKKYFMEEQVEEPIHEDDSSDEEEEAPKKSVVFEQESDDEEEEEKALVTVGEDLSSIDFKNLDEKVQEVTLKEKKEEEVDPLKEIESKVGETLVLNL